MPVTIVATRQPLDATQQGLLRNLFDSPAFSLLKEVVVARCIDRQVEAINAALYPNSETATDVAAHEIAAASGLNTILDLLDDLSKEEQEWWTIKMEPRR